MIRSTAANYLPPFNHAKDIISTIGTGTNPILVKSILQKFPAAVQQTKALAPRFNTGTMQGTANAVWRFLRNQIQYREDSGAVQRVKSPSALVATGFGDCKSYSLFAA